MVAFDQSTNSIHGIGSSNQGSLQLFLGGRFNLDGVGRKRRIDACVNENIWKRKERQEKPKQKGREEGFHFVVIFLIDLWSSWFVAIFAVYCYVPNEVSL